MSIQNIKINGTGRFTDSAKNFGTIVTGQFINTAINTGVVQNSASFTDTSSNMGSISGNAYFYDYAINVGTVRGDAYFYGYSANSGGTVLGNIYNFALDRYFLQNVLLLNGDGSNNQTNASFVDSGLSAVALTNVSTTQGSFSPYGPEGWSGYFNGSSYLTLPAGFSTNLAGIGTASTTFEMWVYPTNFTATNSYQTTLFSNNQSAVVNGRFYAILVANASLSAANVQFWWTTSTGTTDTATTTSLSVLRNQWSHVAVVIDPTTPSSSNINIFINGVKTSFTNKNLSSQTTVYSTINIGGNNPGSNNLTGYISNFKVTKNQRLYADTFTPSTSALTTTSQGSTASNVLLLTLQSNRFVDNSSNAYTLTNTGGVYTQPLDPFNPIDAYNPTTHGGSAYFNGAASLSFASNSNFAFGTGNFTIDFWINPIASSGLIFKLGGSTVYDVGIYITTSSTIGVDFWPTGAGPQLRLTSTTNAAPLNTWTHIALVRSGTGANQTKLYINGVENGVSGPGSAGTLSYNFTNTGTGWVGRSDGAGTFYTGYVSNVRVVKGTAVYTSPFTPPTSLTTAISGTSLLLNFANGGLIDRSNKVVMSVVGDTKIITTQFKYGTGSMYFDGNGDYLSTPNNELFRFGTGDFTVEWWWYITSSYTSTNGPGIGQKLGDSYGGWVIYKDGGTPTSISLRLAGQGGTGFVNYNTTVTPTISTWQHWAVVRSGATVTWYCNGTACGSTTGTIINVTDINVTAPMYIGFAQTWSYVIPASYIDDLRITKGKARYTGNFTPPVAAFSLT